MGNEIRINRSVMRNRFGYTYVYSIESDKVLPELQRLIPDVGLRPINFEGLPLKSIRQKATKLAKTHNMIVRETWI